MSIKVVLGVIGADCHAVGNRIIERVLSDAGIEVLNLGVMVSQEEFALAAKSLGADAILVSSLYGHGEIDCQGLRELCDEEGMTNVLLWAVIWWSAKFLSKRLSVVSSPWVTTACLRLRSIWPMWFPYWNVT